MNKFQEHLQSAITIKLKELEEIRKELDGIEKRTEDLRETEHLLERIVESLDNWSNT